MPMRFRALLTDPLHDALLAHRRGALLGGGPRAARALDRDVLGEDLRHAQRRNVLRFLVVFSFLAVGLVALIALSFFPPAGAKAPVVVAGSSLYSVGMGALLLEIARSWWRTDTLLTVIKYASPESLELIIQKLLDREARPERGPGRRSASAATSKSKGRTGAPARD